MPTTLVSPSDLAWNPTSTVKAVQIFVHLERLGPCYDPGWVHFSFNLSVALTADPAQPVSPEEVRRYLVPWAWQWSHLAVVGVKTDGSMLALSPVEVLTDGVSAPPRLHLLTDALALEMETTLQGPLGLDPFVWAPNTPLREGESIGPRERNWRALLGHVSTLPAPLPQVLRLAGFFRIPEETIKKESLRYLVAAPIFVGEPFGDRAPDGKPISTAIVQGSDLQVYSWPYAPNGMPLVAHQKECPVDRPPDKLEFLNLAQMWVRAKTPDQSYLQEDWSTHFEDRLADGFDMPRRLLDFAQADTSKEGWLTRRFHDGFLAALRDLANFGLTEPPTGRALADDLLARVLPDEGQGPIIQELRQALALEEQKRYGGTKGLEAWRDRLNGFLKSIEPSGEGLPPWPSDSTPLNPSAVRARLEQAYALLTNEEYLRRLLIEEWDQALGGNAHWQSLGLRSKIEDVLGMVQIRRAMALGNVGIPWRSLSGTLHESESLTGAITAAFENYLGRFSPESTGRYASYLPRTASLPAAFFSFLISFTQTHLVPLSILPSAPTNEDPARLQEDLVIQVADLQREEDNGAKDQTDPLYRINGVGVLLKANGPWRCLNLARLTAADPSVGAPPYQTDLGLPPVPVPSRLQYRNGVRDAFISYRNDPIAAQSPATRLSQRREFQPQDGSMDSSIALLGYANPYSVKTAHQLEPLLYGEEYLAAVFVLGVAGNLPKEIAEKILVGGETRRIPWKLGPLPDALPFQTLAFWRRVPVGLVRLRSQGSKRRPDLQQATESLALPEIPDRVRPIARSLERPADAGKQGTRTLVLLAPNSGPWLPGRSQFDFDICPPAVALPVWNKWVPALTDADRDLKKEVWAEFSRLADLGDGETKAARPDLAIDDPAVKSIRLTLRRQYPPGGGAPTEVDYAFEPYPSGQPGTLRCVQRPPIRVHVKAADQLQLPASGGSDVTIAIPAGEVWQVDIAPVITTADQARFHPGLRGGETGRAVTLLIEVATIAGFDDAGARRQLLQGLRPTFIAATGQEAESVALHFRPDLSLGIQVGRVEFLVQRWRWDGRPVCSFPSDGGPPDYRFPLHLVPDLEDQDGILFASREHDDLLRVPSQVDLLADPAPVQPAWRMDVRDLPGALYYRFGVRAFHRYEGLLREEHVIDSRVPAEPGGPEQWARLFVPCRWSKPVPPPNVRLIIPLTAGTPGQGPDAGAGLLVVLNEAAYHDGLGGLVERLESEIVAVPLPEVSQRSRLQLGSDPLLYTGSDPLEGREVRFAAPIGAIGSTFDTDSNAPMFTRSSYILPSPVADGVDLSWYFLKVRLRRALDSLSLGPDGATRVVSRTSAWTEAAWVQLLPPSTRFVRLDDGTFITTDRLAWESNPPAIVDLDGKPVPLRRTGSPNPVAGKSLFILYALVTRRITDALGRPDAEAFVGFLEITAAGAVVQPYPPLDLRDTCVRLVEVQASGSFNTDPRDLDQKLLRTGRSSTQDAEARIIRVSARLQSRS